jgi:hypothetical protein
MDFAPIFCTETIPSVVPGLNTRAGTNRGLARILAAAQISSRRRSRGRGTQTPPRQCHPGCWLKRGRRESWRFRRRSVETSVQFRPRVAHRRRRPPHRLTDVNKGATGRPRTWRPVAKARFRGRGGGNRTRAYITYPKKNCLAHFVTIERILR